jgi:membrane associated rhomboid family serine protease
MDVQPQLPQSGAAPPVERATPTEVVHADSVEVLDSSGQPVDRARGWRFILPRAPVTYTLIALNVLVYLWYNVAQGRPPEELAFAPLAGQTFPQILTYMFAHGSGMHILANMTVLFFLGVLVERLYGSRNYLIIYLLTGILSALVQIACTPYTWLLGASGAASASMVLFVRHYPRETILIYGIVPVRAWVGLLIWIALNLAGLALPVVTQWLTGSDAQMAYIAHLSGLLIGYLLSLLFISPRRWRAMRASREPGL